MILTGALSEYRIFSWNPFLLCLRHPLFALQIIKIQISKSVILLHWYCKTTVSEDTYPFIRIRGICTQCHLEQALEFHIQVSRVESCMDKLILGRLKNYIIIVLYLHLQIQKIHPAYTSSSLAVSLGCCCVDLWDFITGDHIFTSTMSR